MITMYKPNPNKLSIKAKQEAIKGLNEIAKSKKSIAVINIKKLSDNLFQLIRKAFRKEGSVVKVVKKPVAYRFLSKYDKFKDFLDVCNEPMALVFTDLPAFRIYNIITGTRKKRAAVPGDVAISEIVVPAGETDIPPGPALSELKGAGLNVRVQNGKIAIAEDGVVAEPGDIINDKKAAALQKLGIMPFEIRAEMRLIFDGNYIYKPDVFELTESLDEYLATSNNMAVNLSYNLKYPTADNLPTLLKEAYVKTVSLAVNEKLYSPISIKQNLGLTLAQADALGLKIDEKKE